MKKWISVGWLCLFLLFPSLCLAQGNQFILMASTIGPIDSGIIDRLESQFEKETGIRVRHAGAGTGAALDIAKQGNVDLVLVHAKSLEEKFVAEGFGTERIALMYNDFVIVGPSSDPAGIRGMKKATEALKKIAEIADRLAKEPHFYPAPLVHLIGVFEYQERDYRWEFVGELAMDERLKDMAISNAGK